MKNFRYIFIIMVLPTLSWGQITLGPKVGYNIATQFKSDFSVPKFDWALGGAVDIPITGGFSVQGEILFSKKGFREEYNGKDIFDELTSTYLEIPAMAKYTITKVNFGYYFQGGVYWSYWTKGEYQSSIDGENIITEQYVFQSEYDQDGYKDNRSDFGLVAEGGVTYDNLGSGVLALGLRYSHSLVPTNNYQNPPPDTVNKLNKVITISLAYFLYL